MAYFIFTKNCDGLENTITKIAENEFDFNSLKVNGEVYKIIEDSQENFNNVKYGVKFVSSYNNNIINYVDIVYDENYNSFLNKESLQGYINNVKDQIKLFIKYNPDHTFFNRCNDYLNQLNALNLDNINFPLKKSLEQYLNELGQTVIHPLQIP
jgi:hypothetical protein